MSKKETKETKRTIHIFLASSITDLSRDREAIGNFINSLNNIYNEQNLFIHLHKCEDESEDHSMIRGGTQKALNDEIRDADICFIIFWHKVGAVTEQELHVAYEAYGLKNKPKIEVYFKSLAEGESQTEDLRRIMAKIDDEMLHYHREYSHIDSLKLGIIMQLQAQGFIRVNMKVEDEYVKISGHEVISTKNIPVYSQNEKYLELVKKCNAVEKDCAELFQKYSENRDNRNVYFKYLSAIKERERLQGELVEISNLILNVGAEITKTISTSISAPSERIREAIQYFDRGDYEGVLWVLPPDDIDKHFLQANIMEEKASMERQRGIDEYRIRILSLEAQGKWAEVRDTYKHVIEQVEGCPAAPKTIMLEFSRFLYRQKSYKDSLDACIKMQTILVQNPSAISEQETADLLDLMGELYFHDIQYGEAEKILLRAIEVRKGRVDQDHQEDIKLAGTYVRLAKVYFAVTRFFEAEALYTKALTIYKTYDTQVSESVDVDIAHTSTELGNLYYMINRHEDARHLFIDAYHKYTELVNSGEKRYITALAEVSNKIAYLDIAVYSHRRTERYYVQAMKIKQLLTQKETVTYFLFLERICRKLGLLWSENGNVYYGNRISQEAERIKSAIQDKKYNEEKEEYRELDYAYYEQPINKKFIESLLQESLRHYKMLADENPEAFEPSLAQAYNVTGIFFTQIGEKLKAETNYAESITIRERLVHREQSMKPALAASYSNLSQHYIVWDNYEKAEQYALQAIDIYKTVSQEKDGAFNTDLARNYCAIANLYVKVDDSKQAEEYYMKSLLLYIKLFEKSSRAYIDRIINTVNNIVTFLDPIGSVKWMTEFVDEKEVAKWLPLSKCKSS